MYTYHGFWSFHFADFYTGFTFQSNKSGHGFYRFISGSSPFPSICSSLRLLPLPHLSIPLRIDLARERTTSPPISPHPPHSPPSPIPTFPPTHHATRPHHRPRTQPPPQKSMGVGEELTPQTPAPPNKRAEPPPSTPRPQVSHTATPSPKSSSRSHNTWARPSR